MNFPYQKTFFYFSRCSRVSPFQPIRRAPAPPSFRTLVLLEHLKKRGFQEPYPRPYTIIRMGLPKMYYELDEWDWDDAMLIEKLMEYLKVVF